jgi:sugar O-acyltransferase (sialic acid O-acetyltransferase NeuD family)
LDGFGALCGIGMSATRQHVVGKLDSQVRTIWLSLVASTAFLGRSVRCGSGLVLAPGAAITADCIIGDHVHLNVNSSVSHDCLIGSFVTLSPGSTICGSVTIEKGAFVGANAVVLPGISIGANSVIGAGAVVTRNVRPGATVIGSPAKEFPNSTI